MFSRDDLHSLPVVDLGVGVLDEEPAQHAPVVAIAGSRPTSLAVAEDPQGRLRPDRAERLLVVVRRDQDLDELIGEARREFRQDLRFSATMPP